MTLPILIASNNAHKHGELREIFAAVGGAVPVELVAPRDMGIDIDPDENADSYAGNARLKARAFAQVLFAQVLRQKTATETAETWVIADDSGLEVDALNGRPGIHSARYHKQAPGGDGCAELLRELQSVPDDRRTARFQCAIVLIAPDGSEHTFTGTCEGSIAHEKRGVGGFGFDPVFLVPGGAHTMAELSPREKHHISHRGVAARQVLAFLTRSTDPGADSR
ncbi:MAG: non-canonical purine NTP pyrophosphatase [Chloroflexi bacterium]|nr:non-canonical purine NTP pyrophosphatase [Chloroflexota bacterium]